MKINAIISAHNEADIIYSDRNNGMKKILLIVPWLVMGGADKFNLTLVQQLTSHGWRVLIVSTETGNDVWYDEFARYTVDIFLLHEMMELKEYPCFLRNLILSHQPEVVLISNSELGYLLLPYLRAYCPAQVFLDYCHSEEMHWRDGGFPALSLNYMNYLDATLVASAHLKQWMEGRGGAADRIFVRYVNVDTELWRPDLTARSKLRSYYGIAEDAVIILYAARLSPEKLPLLFAKCIKTLAAQGLSFVTLVAGDGELKADLERYVERHALKDQVLFVGNRPVTEMPALMAASDIFFLPSLYEGISVAVYEAMSSGLAVVAADVGGQRELVLNGAGVLITGGATRAALKSYVEVLANLIADPAERQRMGKAARDLMHREFSLTKMVDGFVSLCEHAAKNRRSVTSVLEEPSADRSAEQAVEYIRAFGKSAVELHLINLPLKVKVYAWITHIFNPLYFWFLKRQWRWVIAFKNRIRKAMGVDER